MKRLLPLLSWLLLLQTPVSAQHDGVIWNYEHLSRNDGLSGNRVTALCDDASVMICPMLLMHLYWWLIRQMVHHLTILS